MEVLAVIPARGGSKGLPQKNVRPLGGHPLIAYSIQAAREAKKITRTLVNTDAAYIKEVAEQYKAVVPFLRPPELAGDLSTDLEVFQHTLRWLEQEENYRPDLVVHLRPTSPVRPVGLIDLAIEKLMNTDADSLRVVTRAPITPYKMWRIHSDQLPMEPLLSIVGMEEPYNQPRQKLPEIFWQIGCLDVIRASVIRQGSMSGKRILPYILPPQFAVDIDDLDSFQKAERVIFSEPCIRIP